MSQSICLYSELELYSRSVSHNIKKISAVDKIEEGWLHIIAAKWKMIRKANEQAL